MTIERGFNIEHTKFVNISNTFRTYFAANMPSEYCDYSGTADNPEIGGHWFF